MMNSVRYYYKEILAEIADSNMAQSILRDIYRKPQLQYISGSNVKISKYIRNSNYALS